MILYCHCAYSEVIPATVRKAMLAGLASFGSEVTAVPDLCELAARRDPRLAAWAREKKLAIVACHPRSVQWLFDWAGAPLHDNVVFCNMRTQSAKAMLGALPRSLRCGEADTRDIEATGTWTPWFPVLDRRRCINCKQCVSFCAFGVYTVDDALVRVANPDKCKNNCPACARMCPQVAIIFPKCDETAIDGSAVTEECVRQRREAAQQQGAAGKDLHALLAARAKPNP